MEKKSQQKRVNKRPNVNKDIKRCNKKPSSSSSNRDGSKDAEVYEHLRNFTPDKDLLTELPEEYNSETALANLIDNSLQAVWLNSNGERKLVSVEICEDYISIFDSGPGMDDSEENCIVKWGKMDASKHRLAEEQAIGVKPPYLMPFFGMYGHEGPVASMHLGRRALVSAKTLKSQKVYTLYFDRVSLLRSSNFEHIWKSDGSVVEVETQKSPHYGSFTKIDIFEPRIRNWDIDQLRRRLKDIYFPYIQCDEVAEVGRTIRPIEFQVNGVDLAEIGGGEVAITNLNSCNGLEFVFQLKFSYNQDHVGSSSAAAACKEANARLRCIYLPTIQGKESIDRILEQLEDERSGGVGETYDCFSRVSIRRLGRLLPDARWAWLPFMGPRLRRGHLYDTLKRCCTRVKCFIETDAGFSPTPSKTDLAHQHPYTTALKSFGKKPLEKEKEVRVEIFKDGETLTLPEMEKQYEEWILHMHDCYDEEIVCGEDEPVLVINPSNKKQLGISADVVRVHKIVQRKGTSWQSGQKIKVLKGACAGFHKTNIYAILEFILLEGCQGDAGGEARIICRKLGTPDGKGCLLAEKSDGNFTLDIRDSVTLPIRVIDSGMLIVVDDAKWNTQLERQCQITRSSVDLFNARHFQELEVDRAHVEEAPKVAYESIQSQCSDGQILPLQVTSTLKTPKVEHDNIHDQSPDRAIMLLRDSTAFEDVKKLIGLLKGDRKELEDDISKYGMSTEQRQEKLKILRGQQLVIEQDLDNIQVTNQSHFHSPAHTMYMKRLTEENKSKLKRIIDEIEEETNRNHREMEKLTESTYRYNKFLDEKEPLLQNLECIFDPKESSSNTPGDPSS